MTEEQELQQKADQARKLVDDIRERRVTYRTEEERLQNKEAASERHRVALKALNDYRNRHLKPPPRRARPPK